MHVIKGMDVSFTRELEDLGAGYYLNGERKDVFEILKACGTDLIRLRLWMNPYDEKLRPYGGGMNDIATTIELARRAKKNGMQILLDIHYSDFWADPAKQFKPKAWENLSGERLADAVKNYTMRVLEAMRDEALLPEYVQVGNEVTNGLLWPDGKTENSDELALLLQNGIEGVKAVSPGSKIIIHLDYGTDNVMYRKWFTQIQPYGLEFDIIGMSYYPHYNGSLEMLLANMNDISSEFDKDIMVVETSIGYTTEKFGCEQMAYSPEMEVKSGYPATPDGQKEFLKDLFRTVREVKNDRGIGVIYWEPEWIPIKECRWATKTGQKYMREDIEPGNSQGSQALFDSEGNANPALLALKNM